MHTSDHVALLVAFASYSYPIAWNAYEGKILGIFLVDASRS